MFFIELGLIFIIIKMLTNYIKSKSKFNSANINLRSRNLNNQIILSFFLKGLSICANFALLSNIYSYLDNVKYGIWVTIISVANMLIFMDIGIGNGLRNYLAKALALGDDKSAKELVSTAYILITFVSFLLIFILGIVVYLADWNQIFNTQYVSRIELQLSIFFVIASIILNFITSLINPIVQAFQKQALSNLLVLFTTFIFIILVSLIELYHINNLYYLGLVFFLSSLMGGALLNLLIFTRFNKVKPSYKYFEKSHITNITSLGIKFFIIQLSPVILTASDNMIITHLLGPDSVTNYSISQRLFMGVFTTAWLLIAPLWSSITEAYLKRDFIWIKSRIIKTILFILPISIVILIIVIVFFNNITLLWLNQTIAINFELNILMGIFVILNIWNYIFISFFSGISHLKETLIIISLGSVINVPLSILLIQTFNFGVNGVILSTIISMLPYAFLSPYLALKKINIHINENNY